MRRTRCQPLTAADPLKSWLVALLGTPVVANSHGTTTANLPRLFVLGKATLLGRQGSFMPCLPRHLHPGGSPGCAASPPWPEFHPLNKAASGCESQAPLAHLCWPQLRAACTALNYWGLLGVSPAFPHHLPSIPQGFQRQPERCDSWDAVTLTLLKLPFIPVSGHSRNRQLCCHLTPSTQQEALGWSCGSPHAGSWEAQSAGSCCSNTRNFSQRPQPRLFLKRQLE